MCSCQNGLLTVDAEKVHSVESCQGMSPDFWEAFHIKPPFVGFRAHITLHLQRYSTCSDMASSTDPINVNMFFIFLAGFQITKCFKVVC